MNIVRKNHQQKLLFLMLGANTLFFKLPLLSVSILFIVISNCYAQDTVYLKNREVVTVVKLEMGKDNLRYNKSNYPDGPVYVIPYAAVEKVIIEGGREVFFEKNTNTPKTITAQKKKKTISYYKLGNKAASEHFNGNGSFYGTYLSTTLFPPLGLAVGVSSSSFRISEKRIVAENETLLANPTYRLAFERRAKNRKLGQSAKGFGAGLLTFVLIVAVASGI